MVGSTDQAHSPGRQMLVCGLTFVAKTWWAFMSLMHIAVKAELDIFFFICVLTAMLFW